MGFKKTALHITATLALVSAVYGLPWVLAAVSDASSPELVYEEGWETPEAQLVYLPVQDEVPDEPVEEAGEGEDAGGPATSTTHAAETGASTAQSPVLVAAGPAVEGAAKLDMSMVKAPERTARRATRARRPHRPRPELTKQQQRRRNRYKRRRERIAKQKPCHELIDLIVPVAEDEYWVGRELAACYRDHPAQFSRLGGLRWAENDKDKRIGLKVYLATKSRGDIGRAAGFQRGDVLKSLNGVPLRSKAGSGFALMQLVGGKAKVKFLRDGKEHKITLRVVNKTKLEHARARAKAREREDKLAED